MPPARLLGISIFCLLLFKNSESVSDDGTAPRMCPVIVSLPALFFSFASRRVLKNLVCAVCARVACAVSALLAFKRAIYKDPLSKLSDWNSRDKDPCTWSGVGCSAFNSRVVTL